MWRKHTTLSRYICYFEKASKGGSIVATIMLLINDYHFKKNIDVQYYQNILESARKKSEAPLGLDLLEKKLKEFTN